MIRPTLFPEMGRIWIPLLVLGLGLALSASAEAASKDVDPEAARALEEARRASPRGARPPDL